MRFTAITILKVENGLITEEIGLDDGVNRPAAARRGVGRVIDDVSGRYRRAA
jgi:hypothetical protein